MTTSELTHLLLKKYDTSEEAITAKYIAATQVRSSGSGVDRTADAIIVGNWPSVGYEIQGFEIKISRNDWLNEVKSPTKSEVVKKYCHRWWLLIASETFVKENELLNDWGLMVPGGRGLRIVKPAPLLEPQAPSVEFITGLMRANKRGHISEDLHAQYIQDNNRKIEAKLKKEFEGLRKFAKFIHEAFGIELEQEKRWMMPSAEWPSGGYEKVWTAKVRSKWDKYSPEQLKAMIESALSGDFDKAIHELSEAHKSAQKAIELLDKFKGRGRW